VRAGQLAAPEHFMMEPLKRIEQQLAGDLADIPALKRHLQTLLVDRAITHHLNGIVASALQGRLKHALQVGEERIVLIEHERFGLHLRIVRSGAPYLLSVSSDALVAIKMHAPVTIDRYRFAPGNGVEVFEPGAALLLVDSVFYDGGVIHERVTEHVVYDYRCAETFVKLVMTFRPGGAQVWHFDRRTLSASFATLGSVDHSADVMLSRMIGALGERRALPLILELTNHPSHVVRWSAIQALGRLDGAQAKVALEAAVNDSHPHIRASAEKMLRRL
jgi:HEAT repeats